MPTINKHNCGVCKEGFPTEAKYLAHTCVETGHKPTEIEHLEASTTPNIRAVSEAALGRGEKRVDEGEHPAEAVAKLAGEPVNDPVA